MAKLSLAGTKIRVKGNLFQYKQYLGTQGVYFSSMAVVLEQWLSESRMKGREWENVRGQGVGLNSSSVGVGDKGWVAASSLVFS